MDRVVLRGLGQCELIALAVKFVDAVAQAIGPGDQWLAAGRGAGLVLSVAVEEFAACRDVGAQPSADLNHDGLLVAASDSYLRTRS